MAKSAAQLLYGPVFVFIIYLWVCANIEEHDLAPGADLCSMSVGQLNALSVLTRSAFFLLISFLLSTFLLPSSLPVCPLSQVILFQLSLIIHTVLLLQIYLL